MNQYDFKEFRILRCPHRGKYDNLTLTIELSKEDAPLELELYLRKCWQDGVMLKAEVDEIEKDPLAKQGFEILQQVTKTTYPVLTKESIGMMVSDKQSSIYQEFKWFCERNGKDYEREKYEIYKKLCPDIPISANNLHMKDLEKYYSIPDITTILMSRMEEIKEELGFYSETN